MANNIVQLFSLTDDSAKNKRTLLHNLDHMTQEEFALFQDLAQGFKCRNASSGRRSLHEVEALKIVTEFCSFCRTTPWHWTETDFEAYCSFLLRETRLKRESVRKYQSFIRSFLNYAVTSTVFQRRCEQLFGTRIEHIATRHNCIGHKSQNMSETRRRNFNKEEQNNFLVVAMQRYEYSRDRGPRIALPAARDAVLFHMLFHTGLRVDEALNIDCNHFDSHMSRPQCKNFASVVVWGKAAPGQPKKQRHVRIDSPRVAMMLAWYASQIRPEMVTTRHPHEQAFWLNTRGTRFKDGGLWERFRFCMIEAGLGHANGLTPHSTRHTSITSDIQAGVDIRTAQEKHGHSWASSTAGYCHYDSAHAEHQFARTLDARLARLENQAVTSTKRPTTRNEEDN
ncbi:tyrosine-type recombinase/integrase [Zhongshania borealis]|uniref:Tyr recombinase domain-containing protein n=1 Tax=Zhongshania borealis TaxID=889488 RepID=A0ABP7WLF0_9GAMM